MVYKLQSLLICLFVCFRYCDKETTEGDIVTLAASAKNIGDIQRYISQVVRSVNCEQTSSQSQSDRLPIVIVIDNLQYIASLTEVFSAFLLAKPAAWFVLFIGCCCQLRLHS